MKTRQASSQSLERRDGGSVAAADRVDRLHVRVPVERVEDQAFVGGVDAVALAHLDDRRARIRATPTGNRPRAPPRRGITVRLSVIRTSDGGSSAEPQPPGPPDRRP